MRKKLLYVFLICLVTCLLFVVNKKQFVKAEESLTVEKMLNN